MFGCAPALRRNLFLVSWVWQTSLHCSTYSLSGVMRRRGNTYVERNVWKAEMLFLRDEKTLRWRMQHFTSESGTLIFSTKLKLSERSNNINNLLTHVFGGLGKSMKISSFLQQFAQFFNRTKLLRWGIGLVAWCRIGIARGYNQRRESQMQHLGNGKNGVAGWAKVCFPPPRHSWHSWRQYTTCADR